MREIEQAADFRDGRNRCLVMAKELLIKLNRKDRETVGNAEADDDGSTTPTRPTPRSTRTKTRLPKIEMPKFDGEVTQWQSFCDQFTAIIDNSEQSNVNKFSYLRSLLTGEALASIKGLALTAENYVTAKTILERRFGRKERIIFGHLQEMVTLPRLELMAAVLMARLVIFVKSALKLAPNIVYTCWTDSEIVLHWIRGEPNKWLKNYPDPLNELKMNSEADQETMNKMEDEITDSEVVMTSATRVEKTILLIATDLDSLANF